MMGCLLAGALVAMCMGFLVGFGCGQRDAITTIYNHFKLNDDPARHEVVGIWSGGCDWLKGK